MKKNYTILSLYYALMALGLFVCKHLLNTPYGSSNFSEKFLPFMILLSLLVLYYGLKNKDQLVLSRSKSPSYLLSALIFIPVAGFGIYSIIKGFSLNLAFFVLIIDTALIGIAEEGMFRGIVLGGLVRKIHPVLAILISAFLFSLLHILNILGGLPFSEVTNQMLSTFIMGVFLASMYLDTKNIIFPIIFHSLWDYILLSESLAEISFLPLLLIGINVGEIIVSLLIIIKLMKASKQFYI